MAKENKKDNKNKEDQEDKIVQLKQFILSAENSLASAKKIISEITGEEVSGITTNFHEKAKMLTNESTDSRIVEGVFDGQNMIGPDGKQYPVPANYASKSKLVEGDILKLTIAQDGSFIFKQIGPIERKKAIGEVVKGDNSDFRIKTGKHVYKVLMASLTYFKAEPGDEVTVIVPKTKQATWAAVENVIKKSSGFAADDDDLDDLRDEKNDQEFDDDINESEDEDENEDKQKPAEDEDDL
ncbi:MAG: 50S ribosomal protein L7/L12 [uncultured bacterium]|nr:MAG: 50S ribosomal protein L7/L12 [uncultured bacterium]